MAVERAKSISVRDLSGKLNEAVAGALKESRNLADVDFKIALVPGPGIIGFILREDVLRGREFEEVGKLASTVGSRFEGTFGKAQAAMVIGDGGITVGFWPGPEVITFEM
ncbi:hypothetical protein J2R99_000214 [Rhodopseudomonas julia]|uniref:Uncharacterized protein n=1 Tax=Rhodopseudomonas julia TaxID=200617 RepID=A0ABU0C3V4_9BRAD|nr:hypothetical protein [Rhodopseudomonas julia]MDQ0324365.1 hypothetical protein [Rhodopseudomonas julia]